MVNVRMRGAGSIGLLWMLGTALAAGSAEAQIFGSDPEGLKRTDELIDKAEDLVKEAVDTRKELAETLDSYNALFEGDVENVRDTYKDVEEGMKDTEKQRAEVRKKLDEMKVEADAYFASWTQSLDQIESPNLRKRSEERMQETKSHFDGVVASVTDAREKYEPFMASLKDQWTYLGHDLNPEGIASLKPDAAKLNEDAGELFQSIDAGMAKADQYIQSLRAARPAS